jgi:hypothetical protein
MSRSFNGTTSDYMRSVVGALSGYPVSLSVWVRPTSAGVRGVPIWFGNPGSNDGVFYVELLAAGNVFAGRQITDFGAANFAGATAGAWTANAWQQVGGSYASATSIYAVLNGVRSAEQTASSAALTFSVMDELTLGRYDRTSVFGSQNGQIAHAGIWSAALTETEWASLGAGISPMRVRPQSLHAYFPFIGRNTNDIDIIRAKTFTATGTTASAEEPRLIWPRAQRRAFRAPEPISLEIDHGALTVAGQGATFVANQTVESNGQLQLSGGTASAESELATSGASLTIGGTELDLAISAPVPDTGTSAVRGGGRASRSRRYWVEINGQIVYVNTPAEAQQLFQQFEEQAPREAERQADELVARRTASVRSLGQVKPVRLAPPTLRTNLPESEALREARALLGNLYQDAARRATAALEAERRRWLQDQDDAQTLIALGDL